MPSILGLCLLLAACGRFGFESRDSQPADGDAAVLGQLTDRSLLVRYYLQDSADTERPTAIRDEHDSPLALSITYDGDEPTFVSTASGIGVRWSRAGLDGRMCTPVAGTKLTALTGSSQGTIEVVVDVTDGVDPYSRIVHVGAGSLWAFSIGYSTSARQVAFAMNQINEFYAGWPIDLAREGRVVLTLVVDSTRPEPGERIRLYRNGERVSEQPGFGIGLGRDEAIDLGVDSSFCLGNREMGDRSPEGILYYSAIYETALTESELRDNATRLLQSDDAAGR